MNLTRIRAMNALLFAPEDGASGGGGAPAPDPATPAAPPKEGEAAAEPRTFTQDEVTAMMTRERASIERKANQARDAAIAQQTTDFGEKFAELKEQMATQGLSEKDKVAREAEIAARKQGENLLKLTEQRDALEADRDLWRNKNRANLVTQQLDRAFAGKIIPESASNAALAFGRFAKIETDPETDAITNCEVDGANFPLSDAIATFVERHNWFAPAPHGSGVRSSNGKGKPSKPLHEMTHAELAAHSNAT